MKLKVRVITPGVNVHYSIDVDGDSPDQAKSAAIAKLKSLGFLKAKYDRIEIEGVKQKWLS